MAKIEAASVTLEDGRAVKFGRGEKIQKTVLFDSAGDPIGVRFDGRNGKTLTAIAEDFPEKVLFAATVHGLSQKLGDEYASVETVADCWETLIGIHEQLMGGAWKGARADTSTVLLRAVCLAFPDRTEA